MVNSAFVKCVPVRLTSRLASLEGWRYGRTTRGDAGERLRANLREGREPKGHGGIGAHGSGLAASLGCRVVAPCPKTAAGAPRSSGRGGEAAPSARGHVAGVSCGRNS